MQRINVCLLARNRLNLYACDGTEDDMISCFKTTGAIPDGIYLLKACRQNNMPGEMTEEIDPNKDENNGYLSDQTIEDEEIST